VCIGVKKKKVLVNQEIGKVSQTHGWNHGLFEAQVKIKSGHKYVLKVRRL